MLTFYLDPNFVSGNIQGGILGIFQESPLMFYAPSWSMLFFKQHKVFTYLKYFFMIIRNAILSAIATVALTSAATFARTPETTCTFNAANVILPSSQYTPTKPYSADVWVVTEGRYEDQYYNKVWGEPSVDASGRQWYEPEYELTSGSRIDWKNARAPFSSDEYYLGQKSYQWAKPEMMGEMYMRRSFTLSSMPEGKIYLTCGHDDAPSEWYINGQLVHTSSDGWNNEEYYLLSDEEKDLLKADGSENILAVHVHQNWGGAFADCGLYEADMRVSTVLLPTVADGAWPCSYYILNYNSDIAVAEKGGWASLEENEEDWINGFGPMSNDQNIFLVTEWASQVRPILIRRHFSLDEDEILTLPDFDATLYISYDENPRVYLNGTLIWSASGWNDNDYATYKLSAKNKELLREGDNVLAVSMQQGGGGGHIDYGLELTSNKGEHGSACSIKGDNEAADSRVYNLQGLYLGDSTENLPAGFYIVGGKKIRIVR